MENLIAEYEEQLKIVNAKIKELKAKIKNERNPRKLWQLNHDKEVYGSMRYDLTYSILLMKRYLNARAS